MENVYKDLKRKYILQKAGKVFGKGAYGTVFGMPRLQTKAGSCTGPKNCKTKWFIKTCICPEDTTFESNRMNEVSKVFWEYDECMKEYQSFLSDRNKIFKEDYFVLPIYAGKVDKDYLLNNDDVYNTKWAGRISVLDRLRGESSWHIVYPRGTPLLKSSKEEKKQLIDEFSYSKLRNVLDGLQSIGNVVLLDLKLENVLLIDGKIKIIDFMPPLFINSDEGYNGVLKKKVEDTNLSTKKSQVPESLKSLIESLAYWTLPTIYKAAIYDVMFGTFGYYDSSYHYYYEQTFIKTLNQLGEPLQSMRFKRDVQVVEVNLNTSKVIHRTVQIDDTYENLVGYIISDKTDYLKNKHHSVYKEEAIKILLKEKCYGIIATAMNLFAFGMLLIETVFFKTDRTLVPTNILDLIIVCCLSSFSRSYKKDDDKSVTISLAVPTFESVIKEFMKIA